MDKDIQHEKIDKYLNNELEGAELADFKRQLKEDKTLAKEVALIQDMEEAVADLHLDTEVMPKLQAMSKDYFKKEEPSPVAVPKSKPKNFKSLFFILLAVVGLVAVYFWQYSGTPSKEAAMPKEAIFAAYFEPHAANNLQRGGASEISYQTAIEAYQAKEYGTAIPILEQAMAENVEDNDVKILLANSYLGINPAQTAAAISILRQLSEDETNLYQEEAQWYLALAYLQNEDLDNAKLLLENLKAKQIGKYPKLAMEVLDKL